MAADGDWFADPAHCRELREVTGAEPPSVAVLEALRLVVAEGRTATLGPAGSRAVSGSSAPPGPAAEAAK